MSNKQQGATLITSLLMLLVMTMLGVSAVKISTLDILIAGNDQQKMILFQETETKLSELAITNRLDATLTANGFTSNVDGNPQEYRFAVNMAQPDISETITSMQDKYPCERFGVATSIGSSAPVCDLYDFQINARKSGSSARDKHHRGSGKMVPKQGSKGDSTGSGAGGDPAFRE